jgi:hypothetical protein
MVEDSKTPATKKDIALLMNEMAKLYGAQEQWKREIIDRQKVWKDEILEGQAHGKDEIIRHFDVVVETIRHDLLGANRDEMEGVKDRVKRLERHTGLVVS